MRRRRLTVGSPGVQAGTIAKAFTDMYNSVPSQAEVDQQQLGMEQARAQTDLYRAQADGARLEAGGARREQQGQKRIADLFGGVDLAGQDFNPSGAHPSQQNMVDAPKTDPQNTLGAYQDDELTQAVRGAMQVATGAGMDPVEASTMIRNNAASLGMDPETIQRIGYAADPSYALNENQGVSVDDRERVAARNDVQETALNAADNAASMRETRLTAFADPIKAKPDDMVLPHPDDPRTKGYQGAESRLADRIAAGEETTPEQRAMVGADGGSGTPRNYLTPDGRTGTTLDGRSDAATGEPLPQGTTVSTSQLQTDDPANLGKAGRNKLDEGQITGVSAIQSIDASLNALQDESGEDWSSVGVPGYIATSGIVGVMNQLPAAKEALDGVGLTDDVIGRAKTDRANLEATVSEVGQFIINGPQSQRFTDADRRAAREAIQITQMGTDAQSAVAILQGLRSTIEARVGSLADMKQSGPQAGMGPAPQIGDPGDKPVPGTENLGRDGGEQQKRLRYNPETGELEPVQ